MSQAIDIQCPADLEAYAPLVRAALTQYPLERPSAVFVRHNENLIFRVTDARNWSWLLRIHLPTRSNFPPEFRRPAAIESELLWLAALAAESDIVVQRPLRNRANRMVTQVYDTSTGAPIPCTLMAWIEGGVFDTDAPDAVSIAGQVGFLAARLHLHSRGWTPPPEFTRPSLDEPALARSMKRLHVAVDAGFITEEEYALYASAADRIVEVMRSLGSAPNRWGLIHADLGAGNILVRGNDVSPIDFSLSCFAHFLFDVGGCAASLRPLLRAPFLAGYERMYPLTEEMRRAADALAMVSIIGCFGFLLPSPRRYDWLKRRIPEVAHTYCLDVVAGTPFILP